MKYLFLLISLPALSLAEFQTHVYARFRAADEQTWRDYIYNAQTVSKDSAIDIRFYHLTLDVAVHKKYIQGDVLIRFDSRIDDLQQIRLDLQRNFQIDSLTGHATSFSFEKDVLTVTLDKPYKRGQSAEIRIFYQGLPPLINNTKGLRYERHGRNEPIIANLSTPYLAHYWWPCKDGPGDKADSVYIDVTIPDTTIQGIPLKVVSNGKLARTWSHENKKTFFWRERYPVVPYYVNIAISNYVSFVHWSGGWRGKGTPIEYHVFENTFPAALSGFENFADVLNFFATCFGAYPFKNEKYAMCELGFYSAIEKQTNTVMGGMTEEWFDVAVHELAHMWFGDMITCASWHHGWLNEGFATYAEGLWIEHLYGHDMYKKYMQSIRYVAGGTTYLTDTSNPFNVFIPIIYDKGAWVLHMLRGILGDEIFFNTIKAYAGDKEFRFDHATTEDFRDVCERVSGLDLDSFFTQWIYDEYYPIYRYNYWQDSESTLWKIRIDQVQNDRGRRPVFEMPVQLLIQFADGSDTLCTVLNQHISQIYSLPFHQDIISIKLDPEDWILCQKGVNSFVKANHQPHQVQLYPNYPNPFNSTTAIKFYCPTMTLVEVTVRNLLGQHVKTLLRRIVEPGEQKLLWDGRDEYGEMMPSGLYLISMQSRNDHKIVKAILLE
ncbi:hypothetical protein JXA70_05380 [candidate division KSB1 bacterium]|nr:hypothetical protein [candidate division KSB1 bacterium]